MKSQTIRRTGMVLGVLVVGAMLWVGCPGRKDVSSDVASKVYVAPGQHDEFYAFLSGGFSGQVSAYGLPSGRLLRVIPVFSVDPEKGWGYSEETKDMLMTSNGFIPWDDSHHPELSMTEGTPDGRWLFINANNSPRIARIDLGTFRTAEIIEIPNSGGSHASPFTTYNTEYVVSATRFSVPVPQKDVPISSYKENFKGTLSFVSVANEGRMDLAFQVLVPGFNFDLSHAGKGPSHGWFFFSSYNTEGAHTLLEANASQNDKDFILAINWKKAEEYLKAGKAKEWNSEYYHNYYDERTHMTTSEKKTKVMMLDPKECPDMVYLIPCPKSPHGCDVDPSGQYIIGSGKLAPFIPVFSFDKMQKAIADKAFDGEVETIPILKYDQVLAAEVGEEVEGGTRQSGLGPLHTEFDDKGFAYTSHFITSEVVKWKLGTWEIVDRMPTYYSIGHLMVPGGDSKQPWGKYVVAMNKITKDRYLPTGPELTQSAQLIDISGDKMKLLLDFPTIGEPHYAQGIAADLVKKREVKIFDLTKNEHPYVTRGEKEARVERKGKEVHVYMTASRSHFNPDNIEGIKLGDVVYFHVTNLEQDWDVPHGFAIRAGNNAELLIMPGETCTYKWMPQTTGIYPFYCTDFCSALHQEMQGYVRVSAANSNVPLTFSMGATK